MTCDSLHVCVSLVEGDVNEYSAMKISSNQHTWLQYNMTGSNYLIQPSVIRPEEGRPYLIAYMRDRRAKYIYKSTSSDDGMPVTVHVTLT